MDEGGGEQTDEGGRDKGEEDEGLGVEGRELGVYQGSRELIFCLLCLFFICTSPSLLLLPGQPRGRIGFEPILCPLSLSFCNDIAGWIPLTPERLIRSHSESPDHPTIPYSGPHPAFPLQR
ncbi:hypothetical protein BT69DRAFT_333266 [Atractiella rhizophila]|nr:hypothetical protein BT69DRAFT_333266 [Atractiella rhizophila]